jgi:hypothetical protein
MPRSPDFRAFGVGTGTLAHGRLGGQQNKKARTGGLFHSKRTSRHASANQRVLRTFCKRKPTTNKPIANINVVPVSGTGVTLRRPTLWIKLLNSV